MPRSLLIILLLAFGGCRTAAIVPGDDSTTSGVPSGALPAKIPATHIRSIAEIPARNPKELSVCSFNVQFLGNFKNRNDEALAHLLTMACDIVFIQELLAAPLAWQQDRKRFPDTGEVVPKSYPALTPEELAKYEANDEVPSGITWTTFPNGDPVGGDEQATEFFYEMAKAGYSFVLSSDKTGRVRNHGGGTESEWFAAFYDPNVVRPKYFRLTRFLKDRPDELVGGGDFLRVPHAFGFEDTQGRLDFVAISVHLHFTFKDNVQEEIVAAFESGKDHGKYDHLFIPPPPKAPSGHYKTSILDIRQRQHELLTIKSWIDARVGRPPEGEQDFLILGDMNIDAQKDLDELISPLNMRSLNEQCAHTNASYNPAVPKSAACYDQVFFDEHFTTEIDTTKGLYIFDLKALAVGVLDGLGNPVSGKTPHEAETAFRTAFSDHYPVLFKMRFPDRDDD